MGWRLLSWFWREPGPAFVPADDGSTIFARVFDDTVLVPIAMSEIYIPKLRAKDPDDIDEGNFNFLARLLKYGTTIASATVVRADGPDSALVVDNVAHENGVVSYRRTGGVVTVPATASAPAVGPYLIRCTVVTADGQRWNQRAWLPIAAR